jgi:FAD dependent oxidoreductase
MYRFLSFISKYTAVICLLVTSVLPAVSTNAQTTPIVTSPKMLTPVSSAVPTSSSLAGRAVECDVVVAGGSMAAMFAAISSAREGVMTCLLEPTDWVGGQLTAGGVPAIDWNWMRDANGVNMQEAHKLRDNTTFLFWDWMNQIGNPGGCTVSRNCFEPKSFLEKTVLPYLDSLKPNLSIYYNTVVKSTDTSVTGKIKDSYTGQEMEVKEIHYVNAIQRTPNTTLPFKGYDIRLSQDMADWYNPQNSARFNKQILNFKGRGSKKPIVIEATELGDVMVLSGGSYLQGGQKFEGSLETLNDQCGQSATFTFNMRYNTAPVSENGPARSSIDTTYGNFNAGTHGWNGIWKYRRLKGSSVPGPNQISMMNWKSGLTNNGNDYAKKYLFKGYTDTKTETSDWKGGINYDALKGIEDLSYYFYYWMKENEPNGKGNQLDLDLDSMQTGTGLYKFPYLRDIRRSIGIDNYLLKTTELDSNKPTGERFMDRVALTSYPYDIHPIDNCTYSADDISLNDPQGVKDEPMAFYIPFRSLTNKTVSNMVVGGKGIAQTFKTGAGTRLQPGEATIGTAAGVSAAYMSKNGISSTYDILQPSVGTYRSVIGAIQTNIKKYQNVDWKIGTQTLPTATEYLPEIKFGYYCPNGTIPDTTEGYCVGEDDIYGPFPQKMVDDCVRFGGGTVCTETKEFAAGNTIIKAPRWEKLFTRKLRGLTRCMVGSVPDTTLKDFCVETKTDGKKELYGPFTRTDVANCSSKGGGGACYTNRYSYDFAKGFIGK